MRKLLWLLLVCTMAAHAAGPRFVTGKPYFTGQAGLAIGWPGPQLLYSTDPGDLSANVNHAAADALVAAAAGVWNVPVAGITITQGAPLAEHVSGQNVYFDNDGLHLPADVTTPNTLAILYDTDGSVTDTLLGAGASNPGGCRQNAVTESVDAFDPAGYIAHALIVINGRCTGTAAAAQLQLRYQLMRAFGRVLGLAWSQTNDNVFTGIPNPTPVQAQNWPIMHPLDIICGLYTYQCLPNPFTLRADDIAGLVAVYPIDGSHAVPAGKQLSYTSAQALLGWLYFPTGEGMAGVNVLVRRMAYATNTPETFYIGSGVSGIFAHRGSSSPFIAADDSVLGSLGDADPGRLGQFFVPWFPLIGNAGVDTRLTSTEPVNPLYTGEYTLGPYAAGNVQPSGSPLAQSAFILGPGVDYLRATIPDAAATCGSGTDGTPAAPAPIAATGWWTGLICGFGHVSYAGATVRPGRTFTLEVTALDGQGSATTAKLMPVLADFDVNDNPPYNPPSGPATITAFNGLSTGTTTLHADTGSAVSLRLGIADQRGDGRPDFNYSARFFYADSVAPARVAAQGGTVSISGMGFRTGNAVSVNGVALTVTSWTANTLVVKVPAAASLGAGSGNAVDITVTDRGTGATSTMTAALTFSPIGAQAASMRLISAPGGTQYAGDQTTVPFTVQLLGSDGTSPVANVPVTFSVPSGSATFGPCCVVLTDANGLASAQVTPTAEGAVALQAAAGTLHQNATFNVIPQATKLLVISTPESPLRVGVASVYAFETQSIGPDGVHSMPSRAVTFSVTTGSATFDACSASPCTVVSNYFGQVYMHVIPQSVGPVTVQAGDGDLTQTITLQVLTNTDVMTVSVAPPPQFYLGESKRVSFTLLHADATTPDAGQPILVNASAGVVLDLCAQPVCTLTADGSGTATFTVSALKVGTYTVRASFGAVAQTVTFSVISHQWQLKILSMPPDGSRTGVVAAQPFQVQVVQDDGVTPAPIAGRSLVLGGDTGAVSLTACPSSACEIFVGADAIATAWIIPQQPGPLTLSAIYAPLATSASFTAAGSSRTMTIVSQPGSGGAPLNVQTNLAVQVIGADGVTPLAADPVSFTVLSGPFQFYGSFATYQGGTGGDGIAVVPGLATGFGPVVVQATDGFVTRLISFSAGSLPRVMQLISTPPSPSTTGSVAARPFTIQLLAPDGVTPAPGIPVTFSLTSGTATFAGCASANCFLTTDAQGLAGVQLTPLSVGVIGLLAASGSVTQAVLFTTVDPPDVLRLVSAPATGSYVGVTAGTPFAVQVLLADGTTPAPGRTVTLSAGAANFTSCNNPCALVSNSAGMVSSAVTPTAAGTVSLQAVDGATTLATTFTAIARPDTLRLLSAPTGTVGTGYAATTAFAVQLLQGDGTPDPGKSVTFSTPQGSVRFGACAAATCNVVTSADGTASTAVTPLAAGPGTVLATVGTLTQSATFNAANLPDILNLLSAPADGSFTALPAARPFAVQAYLANGTTPAAGKSFTLSVPAGAASFAACNAAPTCTLIADSSGIVTTTVTPFSLGSITLQTADGATTINATFSTLARPDTLIIRTAPTGQQPTGLPATPTFTVQLLKADGTPDPGKPVTLTVSTGTATFAACAGASTCTLLADPSGTVSTPVTPTNPGTITLTATADQATVSATFISVARPDVLRIISAPTGTVYVGNTAPTAFAIQLLAADGTTPRPGVSVAFATTAGIATYAPCCSVITDASGLASTLITPEAAGPITLTATAESLAVTASFTAAANRYSLSSLTPDSYIAAGATADVVLSVNASQNSLPAAAQSIAWTGTRAFSPASRGTLTDFSGTAVVVASAGPLSAGTTSSAKACAWVSTCTSFTLYAVSVDDLQPSFFAGQTQSAPSLQPVTILITDAAGHAVTGAQITLYQTVTAYTGPCPSQGRCPAAPVLASLVTVASSDLNGRYVLVPLTVGQGSTQTNIAVAAGTSGFTTTTLVRQP